MLTQAEKSAKFVALHKRAGTFLIPNPWDVGSARLLAHLGFEALATTSAGFAFSLGKPDTFAGRDATLAHAAALASATDLPVSVDLENCFGDAPEIAAETIRLVGNTGVAGGSIEDSTKRTDDPIYELSFAVERVRAAAEAAHSRPFPFVLTARAENYLVGRPNLKETIERLQRYQEAGADVLYAPGLSTREEIETLVSSVDRPVNVLLGLQGSKLSMADVSAIGVKRVSIGGLLARAALGEFLRGAREMLEHGTFTFTEDAANSREINSIFAKWLTDKLNAEGIG